VFSLFGRCFCSVLILHCFLFIWSKFYCCNKLAVNCNSSEREREVGGVIKNGERDAATICEHKSEMPLGEERLFISGLLNHWRMDINSDWSTDRQREKQTMKKTEKQRDGKQTMKKKSRETGWQYEKYNKINRQDEIHTKK